jgi:hypothetical protein
MNRLNKIPNRFKLVIKRFLHTHITNQHFDYPQGCLTDKEWEELVSLEYVLTWGYSVDKKIDDKRHRELSRKKWDSLDTTL